MKSCLLGTTLVVVVGVMVVLAVPPTTAASPHPPRHALPNTRQAEYAATLASYDVTTPMRVSSEGEFVSHRLHHTHNPARTKREAPTTDHELNYLVTLDGKEHQVTLRPNLKFLAPHAVVERVRGDQVGGTWAEVIGGRPSCHYHGHLQNQTASRAALSTCNGLTGYLRTDDDEYLIEPVQDHAPAHPDAPLPHLVYKRSALPAADTHTCSTSDSYARAIHARSVWEAEREAEEEKNNAGDARRRKRKRRRRKRSVSKERNVEVTVVADKKMVDYYSNEDLTTYILTVMNMVSSVYHDASIGNAVNIHVVRIMLLEESQYEALEISHNADDTLRSFCQWQELINPSNETHPHHHDVAVLLTRYNICSRVTDWCATLGVSEIAGMCQPQRSCNVNEDTGLQIAYTIAHELGHNFGMNHDGPQNGCEIQYGTSQHVMSPHLTNDAAPITWSNCSRQEITHFLDRNWGSCLEDEPPRVEYTFPELPPGAMYDADHQCRLSYGQDATHCADIEGMERVCQTLWCHLNNRCITRMEPAAEGTQCGKHKWCSAGECVTMGERPVAIHGNWGAWSPWSSCTRSCGAGVAVAIRHCDNPSPANGGRYCTGDRKRYRICNTQECPENGVSFRAVQCAQHGQQPYKGENRTWLPVLFDHSPCQLDCKPDNEFYSVKLHETVVDGTPCKPGTRDMCIHGVCKRVACDWTIEGSAQEDRCGLCHGDGTQCVTTRGVFNETRGSGYVEVVTFPKEARNVRVEELHDAANYFAIRDNITGEYYLNGDWVIHWSGEYSADGVMMYYNRDGETENLLLPGPLKRRLTFMLLFQTENPGISWEYTLPHPNATYTPTFAWHHTDWSVCTVTCGGGTQVSRVQCMEKEAGLVEDRYCSSQPRPKDRSRTCNTHACPAWWWSGPWQPCSVTCGANGIRRRTVICVRSFGPTEQMALLDSACDHSGKPHETEACPSQAPCLQLLEWRVGPWSRSCAQDPCEYEEREVECVALRGTCDPLSRPPDRRQCGNITCGEWESGSWSKCSAPCGEGVQFRRVSCVGGLACRERDEPRSVRECTGNCLEEDTQPEIHEVLSEDPQETTTLPPTTTSTASPPFTSPALTTASTTIPSIITVESTASLSTSPTETVSSTVSTPASSTFTTKTSPTSTTASPTSVATPPASTTTTSLISIPSTSTTAATTSVPPTEASITTNTTPFPSSTTISTITTSPASTTASTTVSTTTLPPLSPSTATTSPTFTSTTPVSTSTIPATSVPIPAGPSTTTTSATTAIQTSTTVTNSPDAPSISTTTPPTLASPHTPTKETSSPHTSSSTTDELPNPSSSTITSILPLNQTMYPTASEGSSSVPTTPSSNLRETETVSDASSGRVLTLSSTASSPPALTPPSTPGEEAVDSAPTSWPTRVPQPLDPDTSDSTEPLTASPSDAARPDETEIPPEVKAEHDAIVTSDDDTENITVAVNDRGITNTAASDSELVTEQPESKESPSPSEPLQSPSVHSETLNEIDVDSIPLVSKGETLPDLEAYQGDDAAQPGVTSTREEPQDSSPTKTSHGSSKGTKHKLDAPPEGAATKAELPEGVDAPTQQTDPTTPDGPVAAGPLGGTKQPTMLEEPEGKTRLEEDSEATMLEEPSLENTTLDENSGVEEERPQGIAVDKIDVDDFEVIEIVELPPKGKKKKSRKKVLLHTGVEAVDALHNLVEEHDARTTPASLPDAAENSVVPQHQWSVGSWSECTVECGGGSCEREVVCVEVSDTATNGTVADATLCPRPRPSSLQPCNTEECGDWVTGEWGNCSAQCGTGEKVRPVHCPEGLLCPDSERPAEVEPCNPEPCVEWVTGPWSLCTRSCGGGYQIRHVKCVDVRTQEPSKECPREERPKHKMACHNQRCPKNRRGQQRRCKDRLDTKLCRRLKHMCTTKFFLVKCCRTCLKRPG